MRLTRSGMTIPDAGWTTRALRAASGVGRRPYHRGMRIEPYAVAVSDAVLDDLRDRIGRTRWPDPAPGEPWSQGTDLAYLQGLLAH